MFLLFILSCLTYAGDLDRPLRTPLVEANDEEAKPNVAI
jgi:hypothetical protein